VRDPDFEPEIVPRLPRRRPRKPARGRRFTPLRVADIVALAVAAGATLIVVINATALQGARHPAPLFARPQAAVTQPAPVVKRAVPAAPVPLLDPAPTAVPVPQPRPAALPSRSRTDLVLDVQRELAARGFYDGAVDGSLSPRTTQAIREFEKAQGVQVAGEANEVVLAQIRRAAPKSEIITGSIRPQETKPGRMLEVQRRLASYGYGPLRITGQRDAETRAAVERFEKSRDLPVTGEVSERLARELAAFTGTPLE
jgi:peptidoglycan hydrolase-like protein with peptidoglycan-binding domain